MPCVMLCQILKILNKVVDKRNQLKLQVNCTTAYQREFIGAN